MTSSAQIRSEFIQFFESHGHTFVPSSPVVLRDDPTLLFANAGMNQFKDVFLGVGTRDYNRAVNTQKCIRVSGKHNDLEQVGVDTYHHTFFEMLGNWSFGDYFKAGAIEYAWKLLTDVWGLPKDRLYVTVFGGDETMGLEPDDEAAELWARVTDIDPSHIQKWGAKDNFWQMAETGPCGPCSEIHIDLTADGSGGELVNADDPRVMEVWNLVFVQFDRDESGKLTPLPAKHADTGMGLERLSMVIKHRSELRAGKAFAISNYGTELFVPIIREIEGLAGCTYGTTRNGVGDRYDSDDVEHTVDIACRVIADHVRTLTFAIADGVLPSNEGRGYVLRRLLRRASRYGRKLDVHEPFIYRLVRTVVAYMGEAFPELTSGETLVADTIRAEEESFCRTLDRGIDIFEDVARRIEKSGRKVFPGEDAFRLYDTYGFPFDLTQLMARERGLDVDDATFDTLMGEQRDRARQATKTTSTAAAALAGVTLPVTEDSAKYGGQAIAATVLGWTAEGEWVTEGVLHVDRPVDLVVDRTCFYAESGGQVGDKGFIRAGDSEFVVEDTQKVNEGTVLHRGRLVIGALTAGAQATLEVERAIRRDTMSNHTATHLLQWALRTVLGDHVKQAGSLVCADYLRFDFTHTKAMTAEELSQVEALVLEKIDAGLPVSACEMPMKDALDLGVMALFGEKYGQTVRVLAIGAEQPDQIRDSLSRELCGGTHVANTATIMDFKVIREESLQTGVRRITAKTGRGLREVLHGRYATVTDLSQRLKVPAEQVTERVVVLLDDNRKLKKQLKAGRGDVDIVGTVDALVDQATQVGQGTLVAGELPFAPVDKVRSQIDRLKKKLGDVVVVFGMREDEKVLLVAAASDSMIAQGLSAGDIVRTIAKIVGGGGGGKPHLAQAGGKLPEKLPEALGQVRAVVEDMVRRGAGDG